MCSLEPQKPAAHCRLTAEEEAQIGLRRGRSAHGPEHPGDLPPHRRSKHRSDGGPDSVDGASNAASAERSPAPAVEPTPVPSSHEPTPPQFDAGTCLASSVSRECWLMLGVPPHATQLRLCRRGCTLPQSLMPVGLAFVCWNETVDHGNHHTSSQVCCIRMYGASRTSI